MHYALLRYAIGVDSHNAMCIVVPMATAQQIKQTRERLSENQTEFAARFGVHQGTIARWEKSGPPARGPAAKMVEQILEGLDAE